MIAGMAPLTLTLLLGCTVTVLAGVGIIATGVLAGFAVLNFPVGSLFLGDGGAYFAGIALACVAVMVPARNPDVSPWISVVVLACPLMETAVSFVRKIRAGASPQEPDGRHLSKEQTKMKRQVSGFALGQAPRRMRGE